MNDQILTAVTKLLENLISWFGPRGTVYLIVGIVVAAGVRRWYLDRRVDRDRREALEEKERTVQRLASEARAWRVLFAVRELGLNQKDAEQLFVENDFSSPLEARRTLESKQ